jgi:hypothetical protein
MKRIIIYPKDIMVITGRSERYSREVIKRIREHLGKEKHQLISVEEFGSYMGLKTEELNKSFNP